jgi:hypothetical protein
MDYENNFRELIKAWIDPDSDSNPKNFTIHRQKQLEVILESYDGKSIPIEHFTNRLVNGVSYFKKGKCDLCGGNIKTEYYKKHHLRNSEAFPVVYAYLCNILVRHNKEFKLRENIMLGQRNIPRDKKDIPTEVADLYK